MNSDKIGNFIRQLRKEAELSQYQLADKIPISRQAVSKWERGETIPDSSTLLRLSEIFDVTINELLKGERLKHNTIKQLESTTLSLVDESNKKSRKIKNLVVTFIGIITLLLLIFLGYYFINSYNSIKVYKIYGESNNFDIYDGMMLDSKQKLYIKIGKIKNKNDSIIDNVTLYYLSNKKKKIIVHNNEDLEKVFTYKKGYAEIYSYNKLINNMYIKIKYNNNKYDIIKLKFKREYSNSDLLFDQEFSRKKDIIHNEATELLAENKENLSQEQPLNEEETYKIEETKEVNIEKMMEKAIDKTENLKTDNNTNQTNKENEETQLDLIKRLGIPNSDNYVYITTVNNQEIRFVYYTMMNQVMMYIDGVEEWNYLHYARIYRCNSILNNSEECKKYVNDTINKYIK